MVLHTSEYDRAQTTHISAYAMTTPPPHPHPHALVVVALRTDDRHLERRIRSILAIAQTYDDPPNTQASVFAKYVHELTPNELGALEILITVPGVKLLNLFDQYPDVTEEARKDHPSTELYDQEKDQPEQPTPAEPTAEP